MTVDAANCQEIIETLKKILKDRDKKSEPSEKEVELVCNSIKILNTVDLLKVISIQSTDENFLKKKSNLLIILLSLLYYPFFFQDLSQQLGKKNLNEESIQPSDTLIDYALTLIQLIYKLEANRMMLIENLNHLIETKQEELDEIEMSYDELMFSIGVESYITLGLNLSPNPYYLPCVYSNVFIFEKHLPVIDHLLNNSKTYSYQKGLTLADNLISRLGNYTLTVSFIDLLQIYPMDKSLIHIMRFSSNQVYRRYALQIFKHWLNTFDNNGKHHLLFKILADPELNKSVQGLVLGMYKDYIHLEKEKTALTGANLLQLTQKAINLSLVEKNENFFTENFESICSLLNFLRYLFIRDVHSQNETKIWDIIDFIKQRLQSLWSSLRIRRAYLKAQMKEVSLKEKNKSLIHSIGHQNQQQPFKIEILNDDNQPEHLENLPENCEEEFIVSSLNKIDLIESLIVRVNDIIEEQTT